MTAGAALPPSAGAPRTSAGLGFCFDRGFPAALVTEFARRLEADGAQQLWVIEDCFYSAGVPLAAAALAVSDRLTVGLGILPAVARNPAVTAMEIATMCELGPGRVLAGIGHGVQDWMQQMGARTPSPVGTLSEVITAVRRLLHGERVSMHGRHVHLDGVRLDRPPVPAPPVLAGVNGPKSLAMAGQVADGLVMADGTGPLAVRAALAQAGAAEGFHVAKFAKLCVASDRATAYRAMVPYLAGLLDPPAPQLRLIPFYDDLVAWYAARGVAGLTAMPADWWHEIGPIGTLDDAHAHLDALAAAGVSSIGLVPAPDVVTARTQLGDIAALLK
jgi:alkanesulfonate monooxygenase SsuD/methylene tetrahydromethanopterin reductase-like flavin-dependent oxidoreductase (luciferase family)